MKGARGSFDEALDQLRVQVEVMALTVDDALQRASAAFLAGDAALVEDVRHHERVVNGMFVSLTERCYDILCLQNPVASDLRLVVSVLRILAELDRIADLCVRLASLAPHRQLLVSNKLTFDVLREMIRQASALFRAAMRAWSTQDLRLAAGLTDRDESLDALYVQLVETVLGLVGDEAVPLAIQTVAAGRILERLADHAVMIGERLRYMLTGELRTDRAPAPHSWRSGAA